MSYIKDGKLSEHFTYAEGIYSETANRRHPPIINTPDADTIDVMTKAAVGMERVRALLGNLPISVSSWYRCHELNAAVGSSPHSQHTIGEAIDFNCFAFGKSFEVCKEIAAHADLIRFDQLISENGWIHISFPVISRTEPRKQVLTITPDGHTFAGLVYYK